ncbi:MAG: hypothetical protein ABIN97_08985, partial [Ginsengibacter sp.]
MFIKRLKLLFTGLVSLWNVHEGGRAFAQVSSLSDSSQYGIYQSSYLSDDEIKLFHNTLLKKG